MNIQIEPDGIGADEKAAFDAALDAAFDKQAELGSRITIEDLSNGISAANTLLNLKEYLEGSDMLMFHDIARRAGRSLTNELKMFARDLQEFVDWYEHQEAWQDERDAAEAA